MDAVAAGYPTALCAPNGSGKSSRVVTYLILWFLHEYPKGRVIVTSGSWSQLENQIFTSLKNFAAHPFFQGWEFLDSSIKTPAGGSCEGISVNDSKKAVGYHKDENSPVFLIIDEASAVLDPVFESFGKCSPTFQLVTGTAGPASGRFFRLFTSEAKYWFNRKITLPRLPAPIQYPTPDRPRALRRIVHFLQEPVGIHVRQRRRRKRYLAWTPSASALRILQPGSNPASSPAGTDFAAGGGNLCVLALARGNKLELDQVNWSWSHANTNHSAGRFVSLFRQLNLQSHQIFADGDGLGSRVCR